MTHSHTSITPIVTLILHVVLQCSWSYQAKGNSLAITVLWPSICQNDALWPSCCKGVNLSTLMVSESCDCEVPWNTRYSRQEREMIIRRSIYARWRQNDRVRGQSSSISPGIKDWHAESEKPPHYPAPCRTHTLFDLNIWQTMKVQPLKCLWSAWGMKWGDKRIPLGNQQDYELAESFRWWVGGAGSGACLTHLLFIPSENRSPERTIPTTLQPGVKGERTGPRWHSQLRKEKNENKCSSIFSLFVNPCFNTDVAISFSVFLLMKIWSLCDHFHKKTLFSFISEGAFNTRFVRETQMWFKASTTIITHQI